MTSEPTSRRTLLGAFAAAPIAAGTAEAAAPARVRPNPTDFPFVTPWVAAVVQTGSFPLAAERKRGDAKAALDKAIAKYDTQIRIATERRADLVLLPEGIFGGAGNDLSGALEFPGPEIERLQALAQKYKLFIGANTYARDAAFPGRYFNTSFLLDRSGQVVLKSYRIHTYHSTSPHDFWKRYLDKVGIDGAFPVARTELGNIAMLPSMELMFPEMSRMLVLRGAEIMLHLGGGLIIDESVKRTRAAENLMFVLSAQTPTSIGRKSQRVSSRIIDWEGEVLADVAEGVEGQCTAVLDVEGLRKRRSDPDIEAPAPRGFTDVNYLSRLRVEICRDIYNAISLYPADTYKDGTMLSTDISPEKNPENLTASIKTMVKAGLIPSRYVKS